MRGSAAFRTGAAPGGALAGPWVRDPLWTRARAVPSLDLRFADNKSLVDAVTGASLVTFTRASSGTFVDSAGVIQTAATNVPRFDHNPTTGESLGLLVEEQRTNLLLNSATLSTQLVTVAAAANTLSFYGTGTVTLTGVSTAGPLVGTGANDRVSLTFKPIVGVLVLTVSGSVTNAQLEAGAFPTSYIPTTTAAVTRSADVASIGSSAFSSWYRQDEGTVFGSYKGIANIEGGGTRRLVEIGVSGAATNRMILGYNSTAAGRFLVVASASTQADQSASATQGSQVSNAASYKTDDFIIASNSVLSAGDTSGAVPSVSAMAIGNDFTSGSASSLNGTIRRLCYWNQRLANSTLQALSQ